MATRPDVPKTMQKLYDSTQDGSASAKKAIKMYCFECVGYDRDEVKMCTDPECPLWKHRPGYKRPQTKIKKKRLEPRAPQIPIDY